MYEKPAILLCYAFARFYMSRNEIYSHDRTHGHVYYADD